MNEIINDNRDKSSAADPIYADLKGKILSGQLKAGVPLRQDDLARDHGISKIPVREALRRLEMEGLVVFEKNKGAHVRHFSETAILQLIDIRLALECRALELAVGNMIASDLHAMRALLDEYARTTDIARSSDINAQFHDMLYEPCNNPQLLGLIDDLRLKLGQHLRLLVTEASRLERTMKEHDEILSACEAGDAAKAVLHLRDHIETTKKEVAAFMRRGN